MPMTPLNNSKSTPKVALITGITGQDGSYLAEFLLEKGAIDMIMDRRVMRDEIARMLAMLLRQPSDAVA